jgi:oxygen-independent coproporphyrinogen-3 oxidase
VSLDLIYGTPGESLDDWRRSFDAALAMGVEHVSAYALGLEPGTRMYARIARGEMPPIDEDLQAEMYEAADAALTAAGLQWYEISNWARPGHECRHNLAYWRGHDWWGIGPGAHSHLGSAIRHRECETSRGLSVANRLGGLHSREEDGDEPTSAASPTTSGAMRWWNVKHPRRYAEMLAAGELPIEGSETLTEANIALERVMLGLRLREGLPLAELSDEARGAVQGLIADGLLDPAAALTGRRAILTIRGRLLADAVTQALAVR